jgi:hypothetical protein
LWWNTRLDGCDAINRSPRRIGIIVTTTLLEYVRWPGWSTVSFGDTSPASPLWGRGRLPFLAILNVL